MAGQVGRRERHLSPDEVKAVLGRAIELEVRAATQSGGDLLSESDVLRIGDELGLPESRIRQALVETAAGGGEAGGWMERYVGPGRASASRLVERDPADLRRQLERYLCDTECMVVHRRFPRRTVYRRTSGAVAAFARATRRLRSEHPLIEADEVDVSVARVSSGSSCVVVGADLQGKRVELSGAGGVGAGAGAGAAVAAGVLIAPPAAALGVPLVVAALLASRAAYRSALAEMQSRLEALLDRLEHGELDTGSGLRARLLGL